MLVRILNQSELVGNLHAGTLTSKAQANLTNLLPQLHFGALSEVSSKLYELAQVWVYSDPVIDTKLSKFTVHNVREFTYTSVSK